jgi:hypothetical protein
VASCREQDLEHLLRPYPAQVSRSERARAVLQGQRTKQPDLRRGSVFSRSDQLSSRGLASSLGLVARCARAARRARISGHSGRQFVTRGSRLAASRPRPSVDSVPAQVALSAASYGRGQATRPRRTKGETE